MTHLFLIRILLILIISRFSLFKGNKPAIISIKSVIHHFALSALPMQQTLMESRQFPCMSTQLQLVSPQQMVLIFLSLLQQSLFFNLIPEFNILPFNYQTVYFNKIQQKYKLFIFFLCFQLPKNNNFFFNNSKDNQKEKFQVYLYSLKTIQQSLLKIQTNKMNQITIIQAQNHSLLLHHQMINLTSNNLKQKSQNSYQSTTIVKDKLVSIRT